MQVYSPKPIAARSRSALQSRPRLELAPARPKGARAKRFSGLSFLLVSVLFALSGSNAPRARTLENTDTLTIGVPSIDSNGVKYYPVRSVYQDSQQQFIRVLEPTHPAHRQPHRLLFVLPVDSGVDSDSSRWGDGLEALRLLDVQDRFNMTIIAPSFDYEPWYGDNAIDPTRRMESFIIDDLVPFGDAFAKSRVPQRYLIGFSKSGNAALFLILKHPGIFNGVAAWDSPAQLNNINATGVSGPGALTMNFGTQANFSRYNIPSLLSSNAAPFQRQNRLWISGDNAAWTGEMDQLNAQMNSASIRHTWVRGATRIHSWKSGWLDRAVSDLASNAVRTPPYAGHLPPPRTGGLPEGVLPSGTNQTTLILNTDQDATCRYAAAAGVAYKSMKGAFATADGTTQSAVVTGLRNGGNYTYYARCRDNATGAIDTDDYAINFSVALPTGVAGNIATSSFTGREDPLLENGMWGAAGSWNTLRKNNGTFSTNSASAARLLKPGTGRDQFAEITFDHAPGTGIWPGVMTRIQGAGNGSGYLAIASAGHVQLYRADDNGSLNFTVLGTADANLATAPRRLRLESQGATHRVYFNGALLITYTDPANVYATGQPGIAVSAFGGPTVKILSFTGGTLPASWKAAPPPAESSTGPTK